MGGGTRIHRGEIKGCVKRVDAWESGDLGWAWLCPTAGVFPFGSQLSYLYNDRAEISNLSAAVLASMMLTSMLSWPVFP